VDVDVTSGQAAMPQPAPSAQLQGLHGTGKPPVRNTDLSHDALAQRLGIQFFDKNAHYIPASNKWYLWDEVRWHENRTKRPTTLVRDFLRSEANNLQNHAAREANSLNPGAAEALRKWAKEEAKTLKSRPTISAVENLMQANWGIAILQESLDKDELLLGTPDGTVDLSTGTLMPARREDLITKLTACGPADCGTEPHRWLSFLHQVLGGDQDVIDFMQRAAGYALTGQTNEHKLLFLHGSGRNGKSVFLETLKWLLGDYARPASSSLLLSSGQNNHPTALAGLQGARLVIATEIPKNGAWNVGMVKELTGGETTTARYMRGDYFDFKPQMTLMIAGNDKPRLTGVDNAMRARMVLVPFDVTIRPEDRDPNLAAKLKDEGPAILRWAIDGAMQWQAQGLDVPKSIQKASLAYLDEEDVLKTFLDEETTSNPDENVKTQDLYDQYQNWCQRQGMQAEKRISFTKDMMARGYQETRRSTGKVFLGLSISAILTE
jgi:putative DNA primase/helicase